MEEYFFRARWLKNAGKRETLLKSFDITRGCFFFFRLFTQNTMDLNQITKRAVFSMYI